MGQTEETTGPRSRDGDVIRRYIAELVGTFVLVGGGVGAAVIAGKDIGIVGVSLAFGLSALAMVYAVGPISGAHLNPAVTVAVLLAGKMDRRHVPGYLISQCVGAILAALVVLVVADGAAHGYTPQLEGLGANGFEAHSPGGYGIGAAFLAEVLLTFWFTFTVLGSTDSRAPVGLAGLAIGLMLTLVHLVGIPITNTSVNPARSLGPALFVGGWALAQLWVFIVAPLLGSGLAAAVYRTVHRQIVVTTPAEAERERREKAVLAGTRSPA